MPHYLGEAEIDRAEKLYRATQIDGYDLLMADAALNSGFDMAMVTDDADLGRVPGLTIYTLNKRLLDLATK